MANAYMPIEVDIPIRGYEELEQLAAHAHRLKEVVQITASTEIGAARETVSSIVSQRMGIPFNEATHLVSGLASLRNLADGVSGSSDELMQAVVRSVKAKPGSWQAPTLSRFVEASSAIAAALSEITADHPLLMRQKATELTYAHQNIFRSSKIITDLRPVFNESGNEIKAMVLTHLLRVEYHDGVRKQRIEFALDEADVAALKQAAERAQTKTSTTQKALGGTWELIVAGASTDQSDEK